MEILITNDDGWGTKGILTLVRLMLPFGHVTVVAPDGSRSGMSSAISTDRPMTLCRLREEDARTPEEAEAVAKADVYLTCGTPADCVKLAINALFDGDDSRINLLASGINHGHNASVNILYSGTMGACFVAAEHGFPAIGFSIDDHNPDANFSYFEPYIPEITRHLLDTGFKRPVCYNVNAPVGEIRGVQWARQCSGHWEKELQPHTDDNGRTIYTLTGSFVNHEPEAEDTDMWCITHNKISIQPVSLDMTAYELL